MRITPYYGESIERFAELISKGKSEPLIPNVDFTVSTPVAATNIAPRNTRINIAFNKLGYVRNQEARYIRLNISVLGKLPAGSVLPVYIPTVPFRIHDILDEINYALGLSLTPNEVENTRYATVASTYNLRIRDESIAWTGNYNFKATRTKTYVNLPSVLTDSRLMGFVYPLKTKPGLSGLPVNRVAELIKLINAENPIRPPLSEKEVRLINARDFIEPADLFLNAKITVEPLTEGHYKGNVDVAYHRITLGELKGGFEQITSDPITPETILKFINDVSGADLTLSDLDTIVMPEVNKVGLYEISIKTLRKGVKYTGERLFRALYKFPKNAEKLHILMNHTLPSAGYLT